MMLKENNIYRHHQNTYFADIGLRNARLNFRQQEEDH